MKKTIYYASNRKAYHDYILIEDIVAGIKLTGPQVKGIRNKHIQIKHNFVSIDGNVVTLKQINLLSKATYIGDELTTTELPLLLTKNQIQKLKKQIKEPGYSLIVTSIYQPQDSKNIKAQLCVVKGKTKYDKREALKKSDVKRKLQRGDYE